MDDIKKQLCGATCTDSECATCNEEECLGQCPCFEFEETLSEAEEKSIASYDTLSKIVEQLESCRFESVGGHLERNLAFISLKRMDEKEENQND